MSQHHRKQWNGNDSKRARDRIKAGPAIQQCIGCGGPIRIADNNSWDAGHIIDLARGGDAKRYGPQHRGENRRSGGRLGARITNRRHTNPDDDRVSAW